jgi:hypothetical protein
LFQRVVKLGSPAEITSAHDDAWAKVQPDFPPELLVDPLADVRSKPLTTHYRHHGDLGHGPHRCTFPVMDVCPKAGGFTRGQYSLVKVVDHVDESGAEACTAAPALHFNVLYAFMVGTASKLNKDQSELMRRSWSRGETISDTLASMQLWVPKSNPGTAKWSMFSEAYVCQSYGSTTKNTDANHKDGAACKVGVELACKLESKSELQVEKVTGATCPCFNGKAGIRCGHV